MKRKNILARAIIFFGVLILGVNLGCPIYNIFGIPCPCCGLTRSWICFLKGNMIGAFSYHPLFIPITAVLILFVFEECFNLKKLKEIFFCVSGILIFLLYIVRIKQGMIIF